MADTHSSACAEEKAHIFLVCQLHQYRQKNFSHFRGLSHQFKWYSHDAKLNVMGKLITAACPMKAAQHTNLFTILRVQGV